MNEPTPEESKPVESFEDVLTKSFVAESLRQHPEDLTILNAWMDMRQRKIQTSYISPKDTELRTLEFIIELADIYRDAGLIEAAVDAYNDAADMAQANDVPRAYNAILAELAKI
ncbi:MAG: hypothetical protein WC444_00820 [Candidatus Paceibacterota bacterium]